MAGGRFIIKTLVITVLNFQVKGEKEIIKDRFWGMTLRLLVYEFWRPRLYIYRINKCNYFRCYGWCTTMITFWKSALQRKLVKLG